MSDSEVDSEVGEFHRLYLSPQGSSENVTAIPASSSDSPGDMMEEEMTAMESMRGALRDSKELVKMKDEQIAVLKSDALDLQEQVQEARAETVSVQETLQFENRALQLELHEVKERSDVYTRQLGEEMLHLKTEVTESQEVIRKKDCIIQELTQAQTQNLTVMQELKDARHNDQETVKTQTEQIAVLKSDALDLQKQVQEARAETVSVQETLQFENRALQLELHEVKERSDVYTRQLGEEMLHLKTEVTESEEVIRKKDCIIQELTQAQTQNLTVMQELKDARHNDQETVKTQTEQIAVLKSDALDLQKQVQEARAETVSVQETLQFENRALQLELHEVKERSDVYTRQLGEEMLHLKTEVTESQEVIRKKDCIIQELTQAQTQNLTVMQELKDARHNDQETVKTQTEQIAVLKSDALDLQEQVQEARAETVSVQETLQFENRALQLELHEVKERSDVYTRQLGEEMLHLKTEVTESEEVIRKKDCIIQELTQAQTQNLTVMQELKDARHNDQETVKTQTEQIAVLKSDALDLQKQVQEARAETVSVQETLESENRALQLELHEVKQKSDTSVRELEEEVLSLNTEIREYQEAVRERDSVIRELIHTQIQNQTLMEVLRNALHDSQETVKSQNQQIAVLESDAQDVQKQVQEAWAETVSVQETLKSAERAFQLELCEEREREERSYTYTRELEKKILTLKGEIRECQDAIREKEITIQELTHFESLAESKDAEIKELRAALCSSKDNEVFLTGQNISLIEEVARLEAQRDKQNGKIENLKEAVRALQHQIVEAESFIWTKDELLTKQTSEIAGLKELTEELFLLITDLKQSNSDLKTQLDTRQEEEILAGIKDLQKQVQEARAETVSVQETLQSENRAHQLEFDKGLEAGEHTPQEFC
ncbi:hypothetical protein ABVT39_020743 [Epinephelus coioides]